MRLFQMDDVLELYPLELEELAGLGYAFGKITTPSSQRLAYTPASKIIFSPSQEFYEFPNGLLDCGAVSELYLLCNQLHSEWRSRRFPELVIEYPIM